MKLQRASHGHSALRSVCRPKTAKNVNTHQVRPRESLRSTFCSRIEQRDGPALGLEAFAVLASSHLTFHRPMTSDPPSLCHFKKVAGGVHCSAAFFLLSVVACVKCSGLLQKFVACNGQGREFEHAYVYGNHS
jgi:hypothetical protein